MDLPVAFFVRVMSYFLVKNILHLLEEVAV
jgi:hypothetical protein